MKITSLSLTLLSVSLRQSQCFTPSLNGGRSLQQLVNRYDANSRDVVKSKTRLFSSNGDSEEKEKGFMEVMTGKVDIPDEVKDQIYAAEANTPAARDRGSRVALYVAFTILGIGLSSVNVFLSNIRADAGGSYDDLSSIADLGFGWVGGNPLMSFFLLNKIGGAIALLMAGAGGTMWDLENRTKNETAEKIWKELERRKNSESGPARRVKKKVKSKKLKNQKKKQRLDAFAELIVEDEPAPSPASEPAPKEDEVEKKDEGEGGLMGKMKNFYDQADQMAASQALLLNKELEDRGVVEKITDETGLKVIGKEAAAKAKKDKKSK